MILNRCPSFSSSLLLSNVGISTSDCSSCKFAFQLWVAICMQMLVPFRELECPWLSEVTIQGKHIPGVDVPWICRVEQVYQSQRDYKICGTEVQEFALPQSERPSAIWLVLPWRVTIGQYKECLLSCGQSTTFTSRQFQQPITFV